MFMLLIASIASAFAQTHTVGKGESLQSIAAKYNVTEEQLIKANPGVEKLFFVGLKLNIPENTQTAANTQTIIQPQKETVNGNSNMTNTVAIKTDSNNEPDEPGTEFNMMLEYGFLPKTEGASGNNYTYAITAGANYYFMHHAAGLFAGARIGYNSANYHEMYRLGVGSYASYTLDSHFISLPINVGYSFATNDRRFAITPYAGLGFNFCVASKYKQKSHGADIQDMDSKLKKKVGIDARIGLQLRLWGFNIGASYVFPLNDNQKMYFGDDSYFAVNIGFGF